MPRRNRNEGTTPEDDAREDDYWRWLRADLGRERKEGRDD